MITKIINFFNKKNIKSKKYSEEEIKEKEIKIKKALKELLRYKKQFSEIYLTEDNITSFDSCLGNNCLGYRPHGFDDNNMQLLLQINFENTYKLENFPNKGILQCWQNNNKTNDEKDLFKIVYHREIENHKLNNNFQEKSFKDTWLDNIQKPLKINFKKPEYKIINYYNINFDKKFQEIVDKFELDIEDESELMEEYISIFEEDFNANHYLGGEAIFSQDDPRDVKDNEICLIHFGDCDLLNILDGGTLNIFIKEESLKNLEFDKAWVSFDTC